MMKKTVIWILTAVFFLSVFSVPAFADSPVVALTHVPQYGEKSSFEGVVFREDGEEIDPEAYRISLYLQVTEGGTYWVKPTYDMPYAELSSDGSFSIRYVTGGEDERAEVIHVLLIPASYTPGSDFSKTKSIAIDYVKVVRTSSGTVSVSPEREAPEPAGTEKKTSGLSCWGNQLGVNVGFYTDGSAPGAALSSAQIRSQLLALTDYADTVRFYAAGGETAKAYRLAHTMGFSVVGTAWLSGEKTADRAELDALIAQCNSGYVQVACVGSETLLRGDLTARELIADMEYVRERLTDTTIPVTTAESVDILLDTPGLRNACEILFPNCYPYWSGCSVSEAVTVFSDSLSALKAKSRGKEIVVSETGWPTAGQMVGQAKAGEAEAVSFFEAVLDWSQETETPVLWFDGADEPWKARDEGESGAHWGFFTKELTLKSCFADTDFFRAAQNRVGFCGFERKNAYPDGIFRDVMKNDWFFENVSAVYEYGLMIGVQETAFAPRKNITVAEAITMAVRLYDGTHGLSLNHESVNPWYGGAVEYAIAVGLVREGEFTDYSRAATRAEVAVLFGFALPEKCLTPIQGVQKIPDVSARESYAAMVQTLYRAGVLTGADDAGSFQPERPILRAEVAAIATRLVDPSLRITA